MAVSFLTNSPTAAASRPRFLSIVSTIALPTTTASANLPTSANCSAFEIPKPTASGSLVIIDTPGFRSQTTLDCLAAADFVLVPVKPSPLDVDRMLDTLGSLTNRPGGQHSLVRCVLTQTTRDSVIARHIRDELIAAGLPVLNSEMVNRVAYPEAMLWGATPSLISWKGTAAREIAAMADEVDVVLGAQQAAA